MWPEFKIKPVDKWGDLKFFECPLSAITKHTWEILRLVNETTDNDGNILNMPFAGALTDQPDWYRQAVRITKKERADHQRKLLDKRKSDGKK